MPPKRKGRPNTPSEDANIAPAAGIKVVNVALMYLTNPDGLDDGRNWDHYVVPLKRSLAELQAIVAREKSYGQNDKVSADDIESFRRADKAAEDVKMHTRADDVEVRINHVLEDFRRLWKSAATGV